MPLTEARKRAKAKYNEKVKTITVAFYPTETDVWNKLQEQPNKQGYIKELIRKDILTDTASESEFVQWVANERQRALEKKNYLNNKKKDLK